MEGSSGEQEVAWCCFVFPNGWGLSCWKLGKYLLLSLSFDSWAEARRAGTKWELVSSRKIIFKGRKLPVAYGKKRKENPWKGRLKLGFAVTSSGSQAGSCGRGSGAMGCILCPDLPKLPIRKIRTPRFIPRGSCGCFGEIRTSQGSGAARSWIIH